jgi:hypothetical protein
MGFSQKNTVFLERPDHLHRANSLLSTVVGQCEGIVSPPADPVVSKILWEVRQYVQLALHRSADLAEEVCSAWDRSKPVISFVSARALMETSAAVFEISYKIELLLQRGEYDEIQKIVLDRMFASRDNPDLRPAQNILTAIDRVENAYEGFRASYDSLSEFAHPNYSGMHGLYVKDEEPYPVIVRIDSSYGINEFVFPMLVYPYIMALEVLSSSVNKIQSLYPQLAALGQQHEH